MTTCTLFILINLFVAYSRSHSDDPWLTPVEIVDIRNDAITILWTLPEEIENLTTKIRPMISVVRSSVPLTKTSVSVLLGGDQRTYTFTDLSGNTTYRTSVEAFQNDTSLWYASNMATTSLTSLNWLPAPGELTLLDKTDSLLELWWTSPVVPEGHNTIITQHLINVYEFNTKTRQILKRNSITLPVPKTSYQINRLSESTVYNITIQAGTSYGYGNMAWAVFSTLAAGEEHVLKCTQKTPNSISLSWPQAWTGPNSKFLIKARTLHSSEAVDKEITMTGTPEPGRPGEFVLRTLQPGSTYNVSITTTMAGDATRGQKFMSGPVTKTAWGVFSTLTQGEYAVAQARIVVETEYAVSIVFQPLKQLGDVLYQIRYEANDGSKPLETPAYTENDLICPKFGCDWLCSLIINLDRKPREFNFEIRARVDDVWNKWTSIARRPWNLLERVCSINPPSTFVENIGNHEFQREIEIASAPRIPTQEVWRYLVVVDSRHSDYATLDISKLADRATADIDRIPYYITGSLSPEEVQRNVEFRLGDGTVRGGYLNYPLRDLTNPSWTLVPLSMTENEIMEPRLKTCGFTEDGNFECDLSLYELLSRIPLWAQAIGIVILIIVVFMLSVIIFCGIRRFCGRNYYSGTKESSIMYYHNESPNTTLTTREFRRIECREFQPSELEQRMRFLEE